MHSCSKLTTGRAYLNVAIASYSSSLSPLAYGHSNLFSLLFSLHASIGRKHDIPLVIGFIKEKEIRKKSIIYRVSLRFEFIFMRMLYLLSFTSVFYDNI